MTDFSWNEKTCPVCGKQFIAREEWVFKRMDKNWPKFFCSYSCTKAWDAKHKTGKKRHFVRKVS